MAVPLLENPNDGWAKIKAGFKSDTFFKAPPSKGPYRFVDGIPSEIKTVQQRNPSTPMPAFGGKTYSSRK